MKIGFNEGCNRFCENHSVLEDLDLCEKYGVDYIDIQSECLDREIAAGLYTIDDLAAWFADPAHHLKMLSYNALVFFNMKQTQEEKDAVMAELDKIIGICNKLQCKMIVVVPSMDIPVQATIEEIRADAVTVLRKMVQKCDPYGIKLSIEFIGQPTMTINRFEDALAIVEEVGSPNVGITLDQYHFHGMASSFESLEKADGKRIFIWHLNGVENVPCGAAYNNDEKRLWPDEPGDCLDHKRFADTLKKIGFEGDVCTMEVFRPDYYKLTNEENIKTAAEHTRAHVAKYWGE
ncbi:MAG: sugar phosphate isomerase/epimerase family protein [Eubacteriales bacterium]|nr:sugar phosphate isomerase/epimerase family protein [Eubacteriales bacterium]